MSDLEAAGFELVPTFRSPHITVAWSTELLDGLARFDAARHQARTNPYHGEPDDQD